MTPLIAGNWKMNGSAAALRELDAIAAAANAAGGRVDVAVCPPFTLIAAAARHEGPVATGAQDVHWAEQGAYTGCLSAAMLAEAGATLVIVGHSERRQYQHETDHEVQRKATAALAHGLLTIVCVGETEAERDAGDAEVVVRDQLHGSLPPEPAGAELVVAYEPVWAIGTGRTPEVADVAAMHASIRHTLRALLGAERGDEVRILYGGSVSAKNAAELLAVEHVNGALVGGASLTAAAFVPIVEAAAQL